MGFHLPVLPTLTGTCDHHNFYISVKFGSQGHHFQTLVGTRYLTELAEDYKFQENGTHFSIEVPYNAADTAFEVSQPFKMPLVSCTA